MESLAPDIRYSLASKGQVRIESPIGKKSGRYQVPNDKIYTVALKDIIGSKVFKDSPSPITVALGKDIQGKVMVTRLEKMPHLLIAGATNSGKSSCLNSLLIGFLFKASPADLRLILIDPKRVEFTAYNGLPHMYIPNAITDVTEAINAFKWAQKEMERRYIELQKNAVRNIQEYNDLVDVKAGKKEKMCYIVIIVDELANLMISVKENQKTLEQLIMDIAAKARAWYSPRSRDSASERKRNHRYDQGKPSEPYNVLGRERAGLAYHSRQQRSESLGRGDMLFAPLGQSEETRIQGAFVENSEVKSIVEYVKEHNSTYFDDEFANAIKAKQKEVVSDDAPASDDDKDGQHDEEFLNVLRCVIKCGAASSSLIQRRFQYGFNKAARMIDRMEEMGFIGPQNNSKPREVYITREKFEEVFGEPYEKKI
ncbi:MAG: FtsK/SpoIIIE domain-containing protein [Christensenellales bacterium]